MAWILGRECGKDGTSDPLSFFFFSENSAFTWEVLEGWCVIFEYKKKDPHSSPILNIW